MEYIWIIVAVAVAIGMFKLLQTLGLLSTAEERGNTKGAKTLPKLLKTWTDPKYLEEIKKKHGGVSSSKLISGSTTELNAIADGIWDSKGVFSDDEELLYSQFRKLGNQVDMIWVDKFFVLKHPGRTLVDFIQGFTGDTEQGRIFTILKDLKPV